MESLEEQRHELIGRLVAALGLMGGEAGRRGSTGPSSGVSQGGTTGGRPVGVFVAHLYCQEFVG